MFLTPLFAGTILSITIMLYGGHFSLLAIIIISYLIYLPYKKIIDKIPEEKLSYEFKYFYRILLSGIVIGILGYCVYEYYQFINTFIANLFS